MENSKHMDAKEAWRDFFDNVRPNIWDGLTRNERRDINTAERDYNGLRRYPNGSAIQLGPERVARLLERFAPDRYGVEYRVLFWVKE